MAYGLGVDIGGTFTDFCLLDQTSGELISYKVPSTPLAPALAVENGLQALRDDLGINLGAIERFVHGSTIAVNTVLQRNGAKIALLVTDGFRDLLEIQRLRLRHPFDFKSSRPVPLVPRSQVFEIEERILADGSIDTPLNEDSVRTAIDRALALEVDGFAVCLINAHRNAGHEQRVKELLAEFAAHLMVSCSTDVWPQMREYERAVVTVMNAYTRPRVSAYLDDLETIVARTGCRARPYITKSNGGMMTANRAKSATVETLLSGPASGVTGAAYVANQAGFRNVITLDLGGTSAETAIMIDGKPVSSQEEHIGDFPVIVPSVAVSSIGAGGGSIAHVDAVGVLKVGPRSAGADPGPACYGRGGTAPTLTDAFVLCGLLNPDNFLGGRMRLDACLAESALTELGANLELDAQATAEAVIYVATAAMYSEFSSLISQRGIDPRDFCLVAFGGAGPLLASLLAREFNIPRVLIPLSPGTLCALGALSADVMNDYVHSVQTSLAAASATEIADIYGQMRAKAVDWLQTEGPVVDDVLVQLAADTRYAGQAYEIEVALDQSWLTQPSLDVLAEAHHRTHEQIYAYADRDSPIELVNVRLRVIGRTASPQVRPVPKATTPPPVAGTRMVRYAGNLLPAQVYARDGLAANHRLDGPAIVEQSDSTVFIPHGDYGEVDDFGNIVIRHLGAS